MAETVIVSYEGEGEDRRVISRATINGTTMASFGKLGDVRMETAAMPDDTEVVMLVKSEG